MGLNDRQMQGPEEHTWGTTLLSITACESHRLTGSDHLTIKESQKILIVYVLL